MKKMGKVKGDRWKDPIYLWRFYCPFCRKDIEDWDWNCWGVIYRHLDIKHEEELKIRKIETYHI
jgi:hypothetical protein